VDKRGRSGQGSKIPGRILICVVCPASLHPTGSFACCSSTLPCPAMPCHAAPALPQIPYLTLGSSSVVVEATWVDCMVRSNHTWAFRQERYSHRSHSSHPLAWSPHASRWIVGRKTDHQVRLALWYRSSRSLYRPVRISVRLQISEMGLIWLS
jgi:hypothetical protein